MRITKMGHKTNRLRYHQHIRNGGKTHECCEKYRDDPENELGGFHIATGLVKDSKLRPGSTSSLQTGLILHIGRSEQFFRFENFDLFPIKINHAVLFKFRKQTDSGFGSGTHQVGDLLP